MRQKEDVEARLSRPQPLKTFRKHNFAEGAIGQAGEGNAKLNARHDAVEVAEQAFDHASAGAAFGHELADARQTHGDERKFRGGKKAVERDQDEHADETHYKHSSDFLSGSLWLLL